MSRVRENRTHGSTGGDWKRNATASPRQPPTQPSSRRPRPGDKWHLDEVFVGINGRLRYLWRAVDQHGNVLDVLVQSRRNAVAAKRVLPQLLKGLRYVPRVMVTDKLASYQVAHRELMPSVAAPAVAVSEHSY